MHRHCTECFQEKNEDDMVQFGEDWVCDDCKASYALKLESGVVGSNGLNRCPYCDERRSVGFGDYFRAVPMGEHLCAGCGKFSKIDVPRWVERAKFVIFLLTVFAFYLAASYLAAKVDYVLVQTGVFLLAIILFVPSVLLIQLGLNKLVFQWFTKLVSMDELMGKFAVMPSPKPKETDSTSSDSTAPPGEDSTNHKKSL